MLSCLWAGQVLWGGVQEEGGGGAWRGVSSDQEGEGTQ